MREASVVFQENVGFARGTYEDVAEGDTDAMQPAQAVEAA